jgi:hypothetical protein
MASREAETLSAEDRALLDRVAVRVVELRMELPALVTLESSRPVSLLAGQAMVFFQPFVQALFRFPDYQRFAALVERREAIAALIERIEARADEAHEARRAKRTRT